MVSGWMVPRGRAPGLATQAVINHCRRLLWEMWGRNKYAPIVVSAPEDVDTDFDEFLKFYGCSDEFAKAYQFCWPTKVYIGWVFEDLKTAKETAKTFKAFFRVKEDWRRIDNRELPVVFVDFEEWIDFYCVRGHQLHPLDAIALRYLKNTNMEKASKQLARDLAEFFKECGGEVEWGVEDE